jgi:hypothetical protein
MRVFEGDICDLQTSRDAAVVLSGGVQLSKRELECHFLGIFKMTTDVYFHP